MFPEPETRDYIPPEYRGLARQFIELVGRDGEVFVKETNGVVRQIHARWERAPGRRLRDGMFARLSDVWRDRAGGPFRLVFDADIEPRGRHGGITEVRLSRGLRGCEAWGNITEPSIGMVLTTLTIPARADHMPELNERPVAMIGFHAVGRWFQRSNTRSHTALTADMRSVWQWFLDFADANGKGVMSNGEVVIPTASGGRWLGALGMTRFQDSETCAIDIRTYLDAGAL